MPGLLGFRLKGKIYEPESGKLIQDMANSLLHLGSYASSTYSNGGFGLGAVGIPCKGVPGIHEDRARGIVLALYGDVFRIRQGNHETDLPPGSAGLATLVDLYRKYGQEMADRMNGDFVISVYDREADQLVVFNDRFGFRHLYVYEDDLIVMFSPEVKAFLCYPQFDRTLDEQGLSDYFVYFYHLGDRTMFRRVQMLPPAAKLIMGKGIVRKVRYWQPKYSCERKPEHLGEAVEEGYGLFLQSMRRRVEGRTRLVVPLSGGLDSRLILHTALQMGCEPVVATFGTETCREYQIACQVCRGLGIGKPHIVRIDPDWVCRFGEFTTWLSEGNYATLATTRIYGFFRELGECSDGLLNGIFGGHLSFGSGYYGQAELALRRDEGTNIDGLIRGLEGWRYDAFLRPCASDRLDEIVKACGKRSVEEEWNRSGEASQVDVLRKDFVFLYNRIRRGMNNIDLNRFFYISLLPFASYELFAFYLTLSPELAAGHCLYKEIYKRKLPHLARIPWQSTGVSLYEEPSRTRACLDRTSDLFRWYAARLTWGRLNFRSRKDYTHYDADYRQHRSLRDWLESLVLSERFLARGLFREEDLKALLGRQRRGGSVFYELEKLAVFELWARRFLD